MSDRMNITLLWITGTALFADIVWILSMMCTISL